MVESSPQRSSSGGETAADQSQTKEAASDQRQSWDPRSPTLGISRTPLKAAVTDTINCLVKQLDEAFGTETMDQESLLEELLDQRPNLGAAPIPGEETNGKNPQGEDSDRDASEEKIPMWMEEKAKQQLSSACAQSVMRSSCFIDPPRTSGGKPTRRKASNKVLAVSGGTGRSPLSILQDDNSPSTLSSRQGKRHPSLAENLGEWKEVAADPGCNLKSGGSVWNDSNKENQHCRLVEN
nr:cell division cycle-associated protein 3 [Pelodiscus sinensis]|eukprot:XP_014429570.2 cell division cycle-associated protein 3 [Pelodiscus sinensis]